MENTDGRKYLLPSAAARLSNMELRAKAVVEGFMTGLHKSPFHGFSVEFAEHRQYIPGDDLKFLDWKLYARTERYYIKRFEEETNLKSYILLDISKSMDFAGEKIAPEKNNKGFLKNIFSSKTDELLPKGVTKLEYGSYLAASLAYLMHLQRDAASLTTYDTKIRNYIPPRATDTNLRKILIALEKITSENETGTARSLAEIAEKVKRRGMVIVISDLFDDQKEVLKALRHFKHKKNEVIVFQVLDPLEISFLEGNPVTLMDVETKEELYSQPAAIQKAYRESIKEFTDTYRKEFKKNDIDYQLISTDNPFDKSLYNYLLKRKRAK
ncbi:DUF58 domain-containing protein [soil metagenome]